MWYGRVDQASVCSERLEQPNPSFTFGTCKIRSHVLYGTKNSIDPRNGTLDPVVCFGRQRTQTRCLNLCMNVSSFQASVGRGRSEQALPQPGRRRPKRGRAGGGSGSAGGEQGQHESRNPRGSLPGACDPLPQAPGQGLQTTQRKIREPHLPANPTMPHPYLAIYLFPRNECVRFNG